MQITVSTPFYYLMPDSDMIIKSFFIFPQDNAPYYQPGWALEHEVIFYCISAISFRFFGIKPTIFIIFLLGLIDFVMYLSGGEVWTFHLLSFYDLYFAAGMLIYVYRNEFGKIYWPIALAISVTIMTFYVQSSCFAPIIYVNMGVRIIAYLIAASMLCVALLNVPPPRIFIWKIFVGFGAISYSLYLAHWMSFRVAGQILRTYRLFDYPETVRWCAIIAAIVLATVIYFLIEKPTILLGQKIAKPRSRGMEQHAAVAKVGELEATPTR